MKINLGSGRRNLEGYVNVDLVSRGSEPNVVADIFKPLPFDDGVADEVLAIHVFEHIYFWDCEDVLKEWMRIVSKEGKLIIECPDFVKAARWLLDAMDGKVEFRSDLTYYAFWGDPTYGDEHMCHKWGWTATSLKKFAEMFGFKAAARPAQFHQKEARDFRLEIWH